MSCNIPTLNISVEDCAGDAAGKHNYNLLVLDTLICNLSSTLITQENSINKVYDQFNSLINSFISINPDYTEEKTNKFLTASTTVKLLSSIWQNNEFSLIYPINGSNLYPDPSNIIDTPAIQKYTTITKPVTSTSSVVTYGKGKDVKLAFDTEYFLEDYESAVASCNGSPKKTGTISLVIDGVVVANYKASGDNKNAGDDTYVSWDQNNITTWENYKKYKLGSQIPFTGGTKFKFTKDNSGIKYSISAVKRGEKKVSTISIVSTEDQQIIDDIESLEKLKSRGLTYLNSYFNPSTFRNLTIVNLNMLISDIVSNPSDKNQLVLATYNPPVFGRNNRSGATNSPMTANFTRSNIFIQKNIILKYQVQNNIWVFLDKLE